MAQPVRFCFDFISPYAYIAWTQIHCRNPNANHLLLFARN